MRPTNKFTGSLTTSKKVVSENGSKAQETGLSHVIVFGEHLSPSGSTIRPKTKFVSHLLSSSKSFQALNSTISIVKTLTMSLSPSPEKKGLTSASLKFSTAGSSLAPCPTHSYTTPSRTKKCLMLATLQSSLQRALTKLVDGSTHLQFSLQQFSTSRHSKTLLLTALSSRKMVVKCQNQSATSLLLTTSWKSLAPMPFASTSSPQVL